MPTYQNNGTSKIQAPNIAGKQTVVEVGGTIESFLMLDAIHTDVVKTSDTPYLDVMMRFVELSFSGAETKTIILRPDEILNAKQIVIYGGGNSFLAEIRLNHENASLRRKLDVERGIMGATIELSRQAENIKITSLTTGTIQAYIEK